MFEQARELFFGVYSLGHMKKKDTVVNAGNWVRTNLPFDYEQLGNQFGKESIVKKRRG